MFFHPSLGERVLPGGSPIPRGEQEQVAKNNPAKTCRYYFVFPCSSAEGNAWNGYFLLDPCYLWPLCLVTHVLFFWISVV